MRIPSGFNYRVRVVASNYFGDSPAGLDRTVSAAGLSLSLSPPFFYIPLSQLKKEVFSLGVFVSTRLSLVHDLDENIFYIYYCIFIIPSLFFCIQINSEMKFVPILFLESFQLLLPLIWDRK